MSDPAEALGQEVGAGTYSPSALDGCADSMPMDRSPQVIRLMQFILFADPKADLQSPDAPQYLILQQYETGPNHPPPKRIVDGLITPLAKALSEAQRGTATSGPELPARGSPSPRSRSSRAAASAPSPSPDASGAILTTLRRAGFAIDRGMIARGTDLEVIASALNHVFLPDPYQPFTDPHPHIALLATFEQVWEPKGYTRGELITTIGLAPGEQLTLELHSWDKTTYKSQDELQTESELRLSQTSNQRDSLTVARETAAQSSTSLSVGATIPIQAVAVSVGGTATNQVSRSMKSTAEQSQQRTADAASTLKTSRKLNIEVSREVGREQKQTRVIANTNRCHTLSCHYFEIMANYLVSTQLTSLQPCLLLPTPRADVTPQWVLCHEAILKRALLDNVYLGGFVAARTIEAEGSYVELQKIRGAVPGEFEAELKDLLGAIGEAYKVLDDNYKTIRTLAETWLGSGGTLAFVTSVAAGVGDFTRLRQLLYYTLLAANRPAWRAVARLYNERAAQTPSRPLRAFLTMVKPHDYQLTGSASAVAKGSGALGLPSGLIDGLLAWGFVDLVPDDAGLSILIDAVAKRLDEIWSLPGEQGGGTPPGFSDVDVATARVNFEQLRCHIDDNWLHYAKAMWLDEDPDERFLRLQAYGSVAAVLGNEVVGFLGHKEAFVIADPGAIKAVDFPTLINQVLQDAAANQPEPWLVSLPTDGSLLEAIVGQCDGCEDFIQQSRVIDLRVQGAKAQQEEAEAQRRTMRLNETPPDLSTPGPTGGENVTVNIGSPAQPA